MYTKHFKVYIYKYEIEIALRISWSHTTYGNINCIKFHCTRSVPTWNVKIIFLGVDSWVVLKTLKKSPFFENTMKRLCLADSTDVHPLETHQQLNLFFQIPQISLSRTAKSKVHSHWPIGSLMLDELHTDDMNIIL